MIARKIIYSSWEPWFSWYPVKINKKKVWLKKIYRRSCFMYFDMEVHLIYEYGTIFDLLKCRNL